MPGTTPNKGWPYPLGTDFVVDGDNAIRSVADALDARMGMYVIKPTSVANGTINPDNSITVNGASGSFCELRGVFTARYQTYRIVYRLTGNASATAQFRMMVGTTLVTTAAGYTNVFWFGTATAMTNGQTSATAGLLHAVTSASQSGEIVVFDPYDVTQRTALMTNGIGGGFPGGATSTRATAQLEDGIGIQKATGTSIGWVKVYGI